MMDGGSVVPSPCIENAAQEAVGVLELAAATCVDRSLPPVPNTLPKGDERSGAVNQRRSSILEARHRPLRGSRVCWLVSLLIHLVLMTVLCWSGRDVWLQRHALQDPAITTSALNTCALFETVPPLSEERADHLEQVLLTPLKTEPSFEEVIATLEPEQEALADGEPSGGLEDVEDLRPAGERGGAAAGVAQDAGAGYAGDLAAISGSGPWEKMNISSAIGVGAPAASAGGSGGGHGLDGVAGSGAGFGTEGGSGNGSVKGVGSGLGTGATGTGPGGGGGNGNGTGGTRGAIAKDVDGGAYPARARNANREGVVRVRVEVLENGKIGQIELYQSSGSTDLDETALKAARKWRFLPALSEGAPVRTWVVVAVRYVLDSR